MKENALQNISVLIAGAGPTGLMLANLLVREKIACRIVDEDPVRAQESRALAIQARSMELFQAIGLVEEFLARAVRGAGISMRVKGKLAAQIDFSDIGRDDTPFPSIFFLSQSVTEEILEKSLESFGVKVERSVRLDRFTSTPEAVTAWIKGADGAEEKISTQYLIGCDGARSQVRKTLGLPFAGGTYDAEFLLADAKINWGLPKDRLQILFGEEHLALLMPLKGSEISRIITIGQNKAETARVAENLTTRAPATIEEVEAGLREASATSVELSDAQWVTRYRVHHRSVEQMRLGRVFLAGDAAHIHSPAGGQGMNTGLQDAANLAWKLSGVLHKEAPESLLDTYHAERMPVAQKLLRFTDRFFSFAATQSPALKIVRNVAIPNLGQLLVSRAAFRRFAFGFVSQLNIRYHESAVARDQTGGRRRRQGKSVLAGRRAPDARLKEGGTVFDLLQGYRFNLLVMSRRKLNAEERQRFEAGWQGQNLMEKRAKVHWIDSERSAEALMRYEVDEYLISLVRPDGYIAYQTEQFAI